MREHYVDIEVSTIERVDILEYIDEMSDEEFLEYYEDRFSEQERMDMLLDEIARGVIDFKKLKEHVER